MPHSLLTSKKELLHSISTSEKNHLLSNSFLLPLKLPNQETHLRISQPDGEPLREFRKRRLALPAPDPAIVFLLLLLHRSSKRHAAEELVPNLSKLNPKSQGAAASTRNTHPCKTLKPGMACAELRCERENNPT